MSLSYKLRRAERILERMTPEDRARLKRICSEIMAAQQDLMSAADKQMQRCIDLCEGICCRNIEMDPIISHRDLVFILALAPELGSTAHGCVSKEDPLYRTDCVFLQNGKGPCVFPHGLRPEVCVTTFCVNDRPIRTEIARVKRNFIRLSWFVRCSSVRHLLRPINGMLTGAGRRFDPDAGQKDFTPSEAPLQTSDTALETDDS